MRRIKKIIVTSIFLILAGCSSNYHTVKKNETLYSISVKNKVGVNEIMNLNNMSSARVYPGQKLLVKGNSKSSSKKTTSNYHIVRRGETLYQISSRYNISVNNLKRYNNLNSNTINIGQKVYLRDGMVAKSTKTPSSKVSSPTLRSFRRPLNSITVTSPYGTRIHPVTKKRSFHHGIDFKAAVNTPVYSPYGGVVTYSGWMNGYGKIVIVDHGGGYTTRYAHLNRWLVSKGTKIKKGQLIAKTGNTGQSTGPHLHYEIRIDGKSLDPAGTL